MFSELQLIFQLSFKHISNIVLPDVIAQSVSVKNGVCNIVVEFNTDLIGQIWKKYYFFSQDVLFDECLVYLSVKAKNKSFNSTPFKHVIDKYDR